MYDPESNWMSEIVTCVATPHVYQRPVTSMSWKEFRQEIKQVIMNHYKAHNVPMTADDIMTYIHTHHGQVNLAVNYKLLLILLDNLGGFVKKNQF